MPLPQYPNSWKAMLLGDSYADQWDQERQLRALLNLLEGWGSNNPVQTIEDILDLPLSANR